MKKTFFLFFLLVKTLVFAQNESESKPSFANRGVVFNFSPTWNKTKVSGEFPSFRNGEFIGHQTTLTWRENFLSPLILEFGIGRGIMQTGFLIDVNKTNYPFSNQEYAYNNGTSLKYTAVPIKIYYYHSLNPKNHFFINSGIVGSNFGSLFSSSTSEISNDQNQNFTLYNTRTTTFGHKMLNTVLGGGYERTLKRGNALRFNFEYQFGGNNPISSTFEVLQADKSMAGGTYEINGQMAKFGFSYLFARKKELNIELKKKDFATNQRNITLSFELGTSSAIRRINDPKNLMKASVLSGGATTRLVAEYMYRQNKSFTAGFRFGVLRECKTIAGKFRTCDGGSAPSSFSIGHNYYLSRGKRWHYGFGFGTSMFMQSKGLGGYSNGGIDKGTEKYLYTSEDYRHGNYVTADLTQSTEFNITPSVLVP